MGASVRTREGTRSARLPRQSTTHWTAATAHVCFSRCRGCKSEIRVLAWPGSAKELVLDCRRLSALVLETASSGVSPYCRGTSWPHRTLLTCQARLQPPSPGVRASTLGGDTLQSLRQVTVGRPCRATQLGWGVSPRRSRQHGLCPEDEAAGAGKLEGKFQREQCLNVRRAASWGRGRQLCVSPARRIRATGCTGQSHVLIPGSVSRRLCGRVPEAFQTAA